VKTGSTLRQVRNFACTKCGACCDRSPELLLSETFDLADVFVFQMMFRLYTQPLSPLSEADRRNPIPFYGQKRLLNTFAAKKWNAKLDYLGTKVPTTSYLLISALTHDFGIGRCQALKENKCGLYERRPISCRSVPLHYSQPESMLADEFDRFVDTVGYDCDTSESAPLLLRDQTIVSADLLIARSLAVVTAATDNMWARTIAKQLPRTKNENAILPSLQEFVDNSHLGVMTTSMVVGWEIASNLGMLSPATRYQLYHSQIVLIENALRSKHADMNTQNIVNSRPKLCHVAG
jgi:Fe-S-cluster containining protein